MSSWGSFITEIIAYQQALGTDKKGLCGTMYYADTVARTAVLARSSMKLLYSSFVTCCASVVLYLHVRRR